MDDIISFGAWVQRRRKVLDLTQTDLARRVGCAVITIKKIEQEERRPSRQMAELLADQLLIPRVERDAFLHLARGQQLLAAPAETIRLPAFLQTAVPTQETPSHFVARQPELARLDHYLALALAGQGQVVFISGEAGRGKTALMTEFARRAQAARPDLVVAGGNCNAYSGIGDPYLPFRDVVSLLTGDFETRLAAGTLSPEQALRLWMLLPYTIQVFVESGRDLLDVLVPVTPLIKRVAPYVAPGAAWWDRLQTLADRSKPGPGSLHQQQIFEEVTLVLQTLARQQPLLLLLDDVQWADSASISLLFHLARRLPGSRILVLAAYRPSEVALGRLGEPARHPLAPVITELKRYLGDIELDLEQFVPAEDRAFVEAVLDSEPNQLGQDFRDTLFWHTKGHPLFTVELLRDMQERGGLVQDKAGRWVEGDQLDWSTLPGRVEAVIKQRLEWLDPAWQELLAVASVEGEVFTAQIVAQVQQQEERLVLRCLAQELGQRHRLVREFAEEKIGPTYLTHFQFAHALFQQYLYQRLGQAERRLLHGEVARVLEGLYAGRTADVVTQLAHHYTEAGNPKKAVVYLLRAGDQARRGVAMLEAIRFYRAALDQWPGMDPTGRAVIFRQLGECLLVVGDHPAALTAGEMAATLFEQGGDREQAGAMQRLIGRVYWEQGDRARALDHYRQALAILETGPESVELARTVSAISQMHMLAYENEPAITWGERALELADRLGAEEVRIHALNNLGSAYLAIRHPGPGLPMLQESLRRALELGLPHDACRAYVNMAEGLMWHDDYDAARANFEAMLAYTGQVHAGMFQGVALTRLVELHWLAGRWAAALAYCRQLLAWRENTSGRTVPGIMSGTMLGWIYNDLGQPEAARQVLEVELAHARSMAEVQSTVPHLYQLARALATLGQAQATGALVQEMLAVIDQIPDTHSFNTLPLLFACRWSVTHPAGQGMAMAHICLQRLEQARNRIGSQEMEAAIHEGQGIVALANRNPDQAADLFRQAVAGWQTLGRPYDQLRAVTGLGQAVRQTDRAREDSLTFQQAQAIVQALAGELEDKEMKTSFLNSALVQEIRSFTN